jgi:ParB-like chromosome segregation protein Spo0J
MTTAILHIHKIPLSHIDLNDRTYSMAPFFELEDHSDTVLTHAQNTGILPPPLLQERIADSYRIVGGWARIAAAQNLGLSSVACHILPKETPELKTFTIALSEAITERQISPMEKAIFFQKVTKFCSAKEAATAFLPLLELPQRSSVVCKLLTLVSLEQPVAEALHNGLLDEKAAYALLELSFRDRLVLFEVISALRLSVSNQRKLIEYCTDLSLRENSSILTILSSKEVQEIMTHNEANPPQKAANLMFLLQSALSPRHTDAQKKFNTLKQGLNLPKWAALTHTAAFEKDDLVLSLTFKCAEDLTDFCQNSFKSTKIK